MKPEQRWRSLILRWLRIKQVYVAPSLTSRLVYRDMSRAEPVRIPETGFPSLHGIVLIDCRRMKASVRPVVCGFDFCLNGTSLSLYSSGAYQEQGHYQQTRPQT